MCTYNINNITGKGVWSQNLFPADDFKKYSKKTNPKITVLEILVNKIQPEITKFKIFTDNAYVNMTL